MFKFIKDFIERLGEENSKTFGNERLDCCDLNRNINKVNTTKDANKNK